MNMRKPIAVIAGVGPGNGAALAKRFAAGGYRPILLARDRSRLEQLAAELGDAVPIACDVSDASSCASAFARIAELGPVDALLFNAGSGVFKDVQQITAAEFESSWRVNALGALLCAQAVIPDMLERGTGSIVLIGATASLRGAASTAAFAPAKAAQRSLAESMARSLGPKGIHVALIIVDGIVDLPRTRAAMPDKPTSFFVDPRGVADAAWFLAHQSTQAWTFEMAVRPFGEKW